MLNIGHGKGFLLLGTAIAISILVSMANVITLLSAANSVSRGAQASEQQSYYSSEAALQYALKQIDTAGNPNPIPSRSFSGSTFVTTRTGGTVCVTTTKNAAASNFCVTDPKPPSSAAGCLVVNTSIAALTNANTTLINLLLSSSPSCGSSLTIASITVSWSPNNNENLKQISIGPGSSQYNNSTGQHSGSTFGFGSNAFTINSNSTYYLNYLEWGSSLNASSNITFTLTFNMTDGSKKTATVTFDHTGGCMGM